MRLGRIPDTLIGRPHELPALRCTYQMLMWSGDAKGSVVAGLGAQAVVLGASVGGLLAARVLADFYRRVTVLERDDLPAEPVNRRGVPQGKHCHLLNARGSEILEHLFPGLLAELLAAGVGVWNDGELGRVHISLAGHELTRSGTWPSTKGLSLYFPSRVLLEWCIRRRLQKMSQVTIVEGRDVTGLTATADAVRVTGVRVTDRHNGHDATVAADLVVDATGRASRSPAFMLQLGYAPPREDELTVQLSYASQLLRMRPNAVSENLIVIFPKPGRLRTWALVGHENDTAMFCLGSMMGERLPRDRDGMLTFGADFAPAHALQAVRVAQPLGKINHHHVPSNRWRRYDKLRRNPAGLLVFGDAISSFNPIYGQGITIAALEAIVLRDCLLHFKRDLQRSFYQRSAKHIQVAWHMAVGSDLALPEVPGPRPMSIRLTSAYLDRVLAAAESDSHVSYRFMRVVGMLDRPASLLQPSCLFRVSRAHLRGRRADRGATAVGVAHSEGTL